MSGEGSYAGYEKWKGWSAYFEFDREDAEYFAGELKGIALSNREVLEIGFGSGVFLAWAKAQGATVAGAEINSRSLREAQRFGVELLDPAPESMAALHKGRFDVIAAFDVLEHLDLAELSTCIRAVETMLKPGGYAIFRFPNGQSPFGLAPQHGDLTHKTVLSRSKIEQLCAQTTLSCTRYAGSYGIRGRWGARRVVRSTRDAAQRLIATILNAVYAVDIPWDSVVVLVLRKAAIDPPNDAVTGAAE